MWISNPGLPVKIAPTTQQYEWGKPVTQFAAPSSFHIGESTPYAEARRL